MEYVTLLFLTVCSHLQHTVLLPSTSYCTKCTMSTAHTGGVHIRCFIRLDGSQLIDQVGGGGKVGGMDYTLNGAFGGKYRQ